MLHSKLNPGQTEGTEGVVVGVRAQTMAKASKKGEGGSAGRPHPVVCWLQVEASFPGLSVLAPTPPPIPQIPAPKGRSPGAGGLSSCETQLPHLRNDGPPCGAIGRKVCQNPQEMLGTRADSELEPEKCWFSKLGKVTSRIIIVATAVTTK